jgi:hypothetical protein
MTSRSHDITSLLVSVAVYTLHTLTVALHNILCQFTWSGLTLQIFPSTHLACGHLHCSSRCPLPQHRMHWCNIWQQ